MRVHMDRLDKNRESLQNRLLQQGFGQRSPWNLAIPSMIEMVAPGET